ncbi:MAG: Lrp/AsnC family transcriptional regulator [Caldimicrobium sp.]
MNLTAEQENILISLLQKKFPLVSRPFLTLSENIGLKEEQVLTILKKWQEEGKLRQISAIFNPSFFQHKSSLFAFKVKEGQLGKAIEIINAHPGVSHNYLRNYIYNLWFTLVVPPDVDLLKEVEKLFQLSGAEEYLFLPILKVYKIAVIFEQENSVNEQEILPLEISEKSTPILNFSERDIEFVKILQEPLPLTFYPFKEIAKKLDTSEEELFLWLEEMKKKGGLRRFAALFKHEKLGFKENIMVAWRVPENRIEEVVNKFSTYQFITHCYKRKSYPHFPYNLYTMCHFKKDGEEVIKELSQELKIPNYLPLKTIKELKKIRLRLFYKVIN